MDLFESHAENWWMPQRVKAHAAAGCDWSDEGWTDMCMLETRSVNEDTMVLLILSIIEPWYNYLYLFSTFYCS